MDRWTTLTEFFACGLLVLPSMLGVALNDFEVFGTTMGVMLLLLIGVTLGGPAMPAPESDASDGEPPLL